MRRIMLAITFVLIVSLAVITNSNFGQDQEKDKPDSTSLNQAGKNAKKDAPSVPAQKPGRRRWERATGQSVTIQHAGSDREYRIHVPKSYKQETPVPLVVCLHGGGGDSRQGSVMGLTPVADRHGFIAVYPNAINRHWNDGRKSELYAEHDRTIDDVAFIKAVIERVSKEYSIQSKQVFVTGASNGGFMTQRMAIDESQIFAAGGVIIASMGEPLKNSFKPKLPVSMLYMNGTEDPLVPYNGGEVRVELFPELAKLSRRPKKSRGKCTSTDEAVALWVKKNGLKQKPVVTQLPDKDRSDGSQVELSLWEGGKKGTAVALYKIVGGGHTLPGGIQYLPEKIVGKTNRDIDGFEVIWQFFKKYARN